ncbi:NAD(P)-dependent oxidoreductase [Nocardia zapadnayensis]|uniref:NAD-dependent epimerase/dehydratase family protein n=1 Tax=Nocardia rhamnosiphila TaxID=426716 RepID=UPI002246A2DF|nr:NAD(P)-dependent oxidoreductase [Nocardia zapadnayensis]MCX0272933.1 NAD(P)-dependent oxidoreductase [Nocardia zapadnayensis]
MSSPVLVTGAFGQVGKRVTETLLSRGHTVIATDLRTETVLATAETIGEARHPGTLHTTFADLLDRDAVDALVAEHRPGTIIHLAAMFSPASYRNPQLARRINVGGTENLVHAAGTLPTAPLLLFASSAAVYGSRNPHRHPELITPDTPVHPIDQYGEDKVLAEAVITHSGLPHALLRLGGVLSPDTTAGINADHLVLIRATPGDNRLHGVDARDVALAFANAVDRRADIDGQILLVAGNDSYRHTHRDVEDTMFDAMGIGRLGPSASLPGDPGDDHGWAFTGWFDTTQSQALLDFQQYDWTETVAWIAEAQPRILRTALRVIGPLLRPVLRTILTLQRRIEHRGPYADPWTLIASRYGDQALAQGNEKAKR